MVVRRMVTVATDIDDGCQVCRWQFKGSYVPARPPLVRDRRRMSVRLVVPVGSVATKSGRRQQ